MDTLHKMRLFVRVVEAGSFTAAANLTNSTTSMMSRAVAELETHLRTRLLHRTTRKIRLTEAGERYFHSCGEILQAIALAENVASGAQEKPEGVVRIHSTPGFGKQYLMTAIANYRKQLPKVNFDIVLSERTPDLIEDGIDVSFQMARDLPDSAFVSRHLGQVFSLLCASKKYLKAAGVPQRPSDLKNVACLQFNAPFFDPSEWKLHDGETEVAFPLDAVSPIEINNADALVSAVEAGMGVAPLPSYTALAPLQTGTLLRVLPKFMLRELNVFAVYPSRKYLDAKVRTWVDFVQATLPKALAADEAEIRRITQANG